MRPCLECWIRYIRYYNNIWPILTLVTCSTAWFKKHILLLYMLSEWGTHTHYIYIYTFQLWYVTRVKGHVQSLQYGTWFLNQAVYNKSVIWCISLLKTLSVALSCVFSHLGNFFFSRFCMTRMPNLKLFFYLLENLPIVEIKWWQPC